MEWIEPDWPAPRGVRAYSTTRQGGLSCGPYESFNLGDQVGDQPEAVRQNRARLRRCLELPGEPHWLRQVHGCAVAQIGADAPGCAADAVLTEEAGRVCAVLTADCLPLLLTDSQGHQVAAVHGGWRGLAGGVIEATLERFRAPARELLCWLGPAIGPQAFEVGEEVRAVFLEQIGPAAGKAFRHRAPGRWFGDLYLLARLRLQAAGVQQIYGGGFCTFQDRRRFFSYRRDGITGRMATLIWKEE